MFYFVTNNSIAQKNLPTPLFAKRVFNALYKQIPKGQYKSYHDVISN